MKLNTPNKSQFVFLLFEGLPKTVIESQVILRCKVLVALGIEIEIVTFAVTHEQYCEANSRVKELEKAHGIKIHLLMGVKPQIPFSEFLNCIAFHKFLKSKNWVPKLIHARTEYSAAVAGCLKFFRDFQLIWDSRGDPISEHQMLCQNWSSIRRLFASVKHFQLIGRVWLANKFFNKALFVSQELKKVMIKNEDDRQVFIVPCLADSYHFFFSESLRNKAREELGFSSEDKILVYSGSLGRWQCFNETMSLINKLLMMDRRLKALILTPDINEAKKVIDRSGVLDRIFLFSSKHDEVNKFLNASDYAIFLRNHHPLNLVASPVKFAEFCLTGLPIIMTTAVRQTVEFAERIGNSILTDLSGELVLKEPFSNLERTKIAFLAKEICSIEPYKDQLKSIYSLKN